MGDFINEHPAIVTVVILAFGGAMYWAGCTHTNVSALKKAVEEIKGDIKNIVDKLSKIPTKTLEIQSPPRLNDLGKDVAKELDAYSWVEGVAPTVFPQVEGKMDYEIQKFSFDRVRTSTLVVDEEMEIKVEICAYERGLVKSDVLDVLAVILRDKLLELSKGTSMSA